MQTYPKYFIGFEELFDTLEKASTKTETSSYPPYNIIKQSDNSYVIEIATAGFAEKDITMGVKGSALYVYGNKSLENSETYIHKGISSKNFSRTFKLGEEIQVTKATYIDGLISIYLERIVPDHFKPKVIYFTKEKNKSELLQE